MHRSLRGLVLISLFLPVFWVSNASAFSFTLVQNSQYQDITIEPLNCQKFAKGQTCKVGLGSNVTGSAEGNAQSYNCDGTYVNGQPNQVCSVIGAKQSGLITFEINDGNTGAIRGTCQVQTGQTVLIQTLCDGKQIGAGETCTAAGTPPNDPKLASFTCCVVGTTGTTSCS